MTHRTYWPELDVMRGIAVAMMILNHFGFVLIPSEEFKLGINESVLFFSSFAPILFFFITGVGYGLAYSKNLPPAQTRHIWFKAIVLVLMEVLVLNNGYASAIGINFLSFIAITMVIFTYLRTSKYALQYALTFLVVITFLRYGLAPLYKITIATENHIHWLDSILGIKGIPKVTYWLLPWLAYPMAGFLCGYLAKTFASGLDSQKIKTVLIFTFLSGLGFLGIEVLKLLNLSFFRWGSLSVAFFLAGFTVLIYAITTCFWLAIIDTKDKVQPYISLRGVSSLAAVPVHYAILHLLKNQLPVPITTMGYYLTMVAILPLTFILSKKINALATHYCEYWNKKTVLIGAAIIVIIFIARELGVLTGSLWLAISLLTQLALCLLLTAKIK